MTMLDQIRESKIIAIVRGVPAERAPDLAEALCAGGIKFVELTFDQRDPRSWAETAAAIRGLKSRMGNRMGVGAGTVMSLQQLHMACDAGASYIISPNVDGALIKETKRLGALSFPGAMTASEAAYAASCGADVIKIFPAGELGPGYIKALKGPLAHLELMAVGGVNEKNAGDFIRAGAAAVGVGGSLVNRKWILSGEFDRITALAAAYVEAVK